MDIIPTADTTANPANITIDLEAGQAKQQSEPEAQQGAAAASSSTPAATPITTKEEEEERHPFRFLLYAFVGLAVIGLIALIVVKSGQGSPAGGGSGGAPGTQLGEKAYLDFLHQQNLAGNIAPPANTPTPTALAQLAKDTAWCEQMGNQHGVQPGHDWGTLNDPAVQKEWGNKSCDKLYTTPWKPATKGKWCTWDDDCESGTCIHEWNGSGRQYCQ